MIEYNINISEFIKDWCEITSIRDPKNMFLYFSYKKGEEYSANSDKFLLLPDSKKLTDSNCFIAKRDNLFIPIYGTSNMFHDRLCRALENPEDFYAKYHIQLANHWGIEEAEKEISNNIKLLFDCRHSFENFNLVWVTFLLRDMINFSSFDFDLLSLYQKLIQELRNRGINPRHTKTKTKHQFIYFWDNQKFEGSSLKELFKLLNTLTDILISYNRIAILDYTQYENALTGLFLANLTARRTYKHEDSKK